MEPGLGANAEQVADVGAGNDEHDEGGGEEHSERPRDRTHQFRPEGTRHDLETRQEARVGGVVAEAVGELTHQAGQFPRDVIGTDAGTHARDRATAGLTEAPGRRSHVEGHPGGDVVTRKAELRSKDADDLARITIDDEGLADDVRIATEPVLPDPM